MKSYTQRRNLFASMVGKSDTTTLVLADQWMNDGERFIIGMPVNWKFLEAAFTRTTTAGNGTYFLPYNYDKLSSVKIRFGTYDYVVRQVKSRNEWNRIIAVPYQSDYPLFYYLNERTIEFYPTPSTAGNTITFNYKKRVVDLQNPDYVTGTVTATNGSTVITGAGTTFTAAMVGRYFKVNADGNWYLITSFTNATTIGLEQAYQGLTVAGAAFTIGEISSLPENQDMLPVYYALREYWRQTNQLDRAREYERFFKEGVEELKKDNISSSMNIGLDDHDNIHNPNYYPSNIT